MIDTIKFKFKTLDHDFFLFTINAKAPLHVGFQPCFDTPQKCGFINASVSMNMLSGTGGQGN